MEETKRKLFTWRIRPIDVPLIGRLFRAAEVVDLSATHLVRQAVKEKLDRLAVQYPEIDAPQAPQSTAATTN